VLSWCGHDQEVVDRDDPWRKEDEQRVIVKVTPEN
jgi:hypothetical protein